MFLLLLAGLVLFAAFASNAGAVKGQGTGFQGVVIVALVVIVAYFIYPYVHLFVDPIANAVIAH